MFIRLKVITVLLLIVITAGCSSFPRYRPELPEDIGSDGLVVGQVAGIGTLSGWSTHVDVLINGRKKGLVVNGFIAIPLSPGEYSLDALYSETYGGSSSYGSVTVTTKNTRSLPLKKKFTVRAHEVTDLGLLILYPDPQDKEHKKFLRFYLDNRPDMKQFVRYSYPTLAGKMNVDAMTLVPGDLMPANLLPELRKELASKAAQRAGGMVPYVAADVGTLAEVQAAPDGKISGVRLIDIPTLSGVQHASPYFVKDRMAFLTTNNRLFLVQNGKAVEKRAPAGLRAGRVFIFSASDMVILDDHFEVYTSGDNGDRWQSNLTLRTEDIVSPKIAVGKTGYYVYREKNPVLLYSRYGRTDFAPVDLPKDMKELGVIQERPAGMFAEQAISFYMETEQRPFYFRPSSGTAWEKRLMPAPNCQYMRFLEGESVFTECSDRAVGFGGTKVPYTSKDNGMSWQKK